MHHENLKQHTPPPAAGNGHHSRLSPLDWMRDPRVATTFTIASLGLISLSAARSGSALASDTPVTGPTPGTEIVGPSGPTGPTSPVESTGPTGPPAPDVSTAPETTGVPQEAPGTNYSMTELSGPDGGGWSFFGDPRAVRSGNDLYTGWIDRKGYVEVAQKNLETDEEKVVKLRPNLGRPDDHNNPSLVVRKDGRITAYYSPHSGRELPLKGVSRMYYRTTVKPGDISKWDSPHYLRTNSEGGLGYTYPNPVDIGKGRTWLGWRGGNWQPTASVGNKRGWSHAHSFIKSSVHKRPYAKYAPGAGNSVLVGYNQNNGQVGNTDLYYIKYIDGKGYFRANGKRIGGKDSEVPTYKGDHVLSHREYDDVWVMDIAENAQKRPVILSSAAKKGQGSSFFYSAYDGKKWQTSEIAYSGYNMLKDPSPNYLSYVTGGGTLDHADPSQVYLSRKGDSDNMVVEKWHLDPNTSSWQAEAVSPPDMSCVRPTVARGDKFGNILMMCGKYINWVKFQTAIFLARPKK